MATNLALFASGSMKFVQNGRSDTIFLQIYGDCSRRHLAIRFPLFPAFRGEVADPGLEPGEGRWGAAGSGVVTGLGADSLPGLARRPLRPPSPFGLRPVPLPTLWGGSAAAHTPHSDIAYGLRRLSR